MTTSWPIVKLGVVVNYRKEFITIDDLTSYKRPRVQLHGQGVVLRDEVPGALIKTKQQQVCRAGELLVAEIDAKVGGFGIVPPELDGALVSSHYFLYTADTSRVVIPFLGWFIKTPAFRDQVEAQGSTNYAAIRPADVVGYEMPLPPLEEQRGIVARIDELSGRIAVCQSLREQARASVNALGVAAVRERFLNRKHWVRLTVEQACSNIVDYRGRTPPIAESGIPHLTSANIRNGRIEWSTTKYVTDATYTQFMTRGIPQPGDVLFTMEAPLGEVAVVPSHRQFSLAQRLILLRPKAEILDGDFLATVLSSPVVQEEIRSKATATTVRGIASKRLKHITIPVPPKDEQESIVRHVREVRLALEETELMQREVETELNALLPSILDRAFKGEL